MEDTSQQEKATQDLRDYFTPFTEGLVDLDDEEAIGIYRQRFQNLPGSVLQILQDFSTAEYIEEKLGGDFVLDAEQKRGIARVIRDVFLGELYIGDMGNALSKQYGIEWETAKNIVQRIQIQLFTPALDDIKRIQRERFPQRVNPAAPPRIPPAQNVYQQTPDVNPGNVVDLRNSQQ